MNQVCGKRRGELAQEKETREKTEKRVAALEDKMSGIDAKWERELEKKQSTIINLQTHYTKQSAIIKKLREEMAKIKVVAENSQREAVDKGKRVECLEKELEAEKQAKLLAQESAHSDQLALQSLKDELDDSKTAHQTALADARSIEARLNFVTSEEGKREVIEAYRQRPVGKVKLTLAIKAGFDYLKAQLPQNDASSSDPAYPPRVQSCLPMLLELKKKGAGV